MRSNSSMTYLRTTLGLFLFGILLGFVCGGVQYAGAILLFMCFALATVIVYGFDLRGKLVGVVTMDAGLVVGAAIRAAYWRSQHEFSTLVNWKYAIELFLVALLISGAMKGLLSLVEKIWPPDDSLGNAPDNSARPTGDPR